MATYLQYYVKPFYILFSHLKTIQSIFMKFSGDMGMDITRKYIAITGVSKCSFYGNIYQYSVTFLAYLNATHSLFRIFMIFPGDVDIALHCTPKYIVTMDINLCGFYGNIIVIFCHDSYILI